MREGVGGIFQTPHILNQQSTTACSTEKERPIEYQFALQRLHGAMRKRCSLVEEDSKLNESWASKIREVSVRAIQHVSEVLKGMIVAAFLAAGSTIGGKIMGGFESCAVRLQNSFSGLERTCSSRRVQDILDKKRARVVAV